MSVTHIPQVAIETATYTNGSVTLPPWMTLICALRRVNLSPLWRFWFW
ncbi:Uncharacterised protein [Citrobacter koseri]|nr:Uncharacterised protein [Citrobacter koseri]